MAAPGPSATVQGGVQAGRRWSGGAQPRPVHPRTGGGPAAAAGAGASGAASAFLTCGWSQASGDRAAALRPAPGLGSNLVLKPHLSQGGSGPVGGPGGDVTALFSRPLLTRRPGLPRTRSGPPVGDACLQAVANGPPARGLDKIGVAPRASGSRPGPGAIRPHLPPHGGEGVGVCPRGAPRLRGRVGLRLDHWPPLDPALPPERA